MRNMQTERERWATALDSIRFLRHQALTAVDHMRQNENRQDPAWRHLWGHWQEELKELRTCELDAKAALAQLAELHQRAA